MARREPALLKGSLTLQLGQLMLLLTSELAVEKTLSQDEAFEALCSEAPHAIRKRLRAVLSDVDHARAALQRGEQLHVSGRVQWSVPDPLEETPGGGDCFNTASAWVPSRKFPAISMPGSGRCCSTAAAW